MKRKKLLSFFATCTLILLVGFTAFSQQVGKTTVTFNDPTRTGGFGSGGGAGRQIQCEIYYPAATAGTDVPVSGSGYPVLVFGHGFAMAWDAYQNLWDYYIPKGYIMVFPRTEGGLIPSPVHADFGKDLALVVTKMKELNAESVSMFYQKMSGKSAVMGHSMGGGSSFLATENVSSNDITTMVTFAPAVTNPSSVTAGANITIPSFVISGQNDCVASPAEHQIPEYDSLASPIKAYAELKGAGHCYFANTNTNCSFGEGTCTPNPTLSRSEQQAMAQLYAYYWLEYFLKDNCSAWTSLKDTLDNSQTLSAKQRTFDFNDPIVSQNGNSLNSSSATTYQWYNGTTPINGATSQNYSPSANGTYYVEVTYVNGCKYKSAGFNYVSTGIGASASNILFRSYPNPTRTNLTIELNNATEGVEMKMMDMTGRVVYNGKTGRTSKSEIEMSSFAKGQYILEVNYQGSVIRQKIVKE